VIIAAIFYVYATYHAVDIYVRGDVSEFLAYSFIPLAFYGAFKIFNGKSWTRAIILSIGLCGIILSHSLTAFMVAPFIFAFFLFLFFYSKNKLLFLVRFLFGTILGVMLSAFYWIPTVFEMKYTNVLSQIGGSADFHRHFVCIQQLWYSPWGFGGSTGDCNDGLSFMIGKIHIVIVLVGILGALLAWKKHKMIRNVIVLFSFGFLFSIFLTLEFSKSIWENVPFMIFLQYPWRFLLMVSFFSSFLAGSFSYIINSLDFPKKYKNTYLFFLTTLILFACVFLQAKFFVPQKKLTVDSNYYTNSVSLKWTTSKISDEYMPPIFQRPKSKDRVVNNFISPRVGRALLNKTQIKSVDVLLKDPANLQLNIAYFPAWHVYIDQQETRYEVNNLGMMINVPKGHHKIKAEFMETTVEKVSDIISFIGILTALVGIIIFKQKYENTPG